MEPLTHARVSVLSRLSDFKSSNTIVSLDSVTFQILKAQIRVFHIDFFYREIDRQRVEIKRSTSYHREGSTLHTSHNITLVIIFLHKHFYMSAELGGATETFQVIQERIQVK